MKNIGLYRSMLAQPASTILFESICLQVDAEIAQTQPLIQYLSGHLQRWPEDIVRLMPEHWTNAIQKDDDAPKMALCNALRDRPKGTINRLLSKPQARYITHLDYRHAPLSQRVITILRKTHPSPIFRMDLRHCQITDEMLSKLLRIPRLSGLKTLFLQHNQITSEGIDILVQSPLYPTLKVLDLRYNTIGNQGAQTLAQTPNQLTRLDLYMGDVSFGGCAILSESEHMSAPIRQVFRGRIQTL